MFSPHWCPFSVMTPDTQRTATKPESLVNESCTKQQRVSVLTWLKKFSAVNPLSSPFSERKDFKLNDFLHYAVNNIEFSHKERKALYTRQH